MNTKFSILTSLALISTNIIIGNLYPPNGIVLTPLIITICTLLILIGAKGYRPIIKSSSISALIILNDIGIKLYAGGIHDRQGSAWIHLFLFIGLGVSFLLILINTFKEEKYDFKEKIAAILILPLSLVLHLYLFSDLGMVS